MQKRIMSLILSFLILFSTVGKRKISAENAVSDSIREGVLVGDLNQDGRIGAMDLIYLKRYLLGDCPIQITLDTADISLDNEINIKDLVRLKKMLAGENRVTYSNRQNDGIVFWILKDEGTSTVTPVGYRVISNCHITTDTITDSRRVYEVTAFVCAEENPSPEFDLPEISIGVTTINEINIELQSSTNIIFSRSWLWSYKVGYPNDLLAPENSEFDCLIKAMHKSDIVSYRGIHNKFTF